METFKYYTEFTDCFHVVAAVMSRCSQCVGQNTNPASLMTSGLVSGDRDVM